FSAACWSLGITSLPYSLLASVPLLRLRRSLPAPGGASVGWLLSSSFPAKRSPAVCRTAPAAPPRGPSNPPALVPVLLPVKPPPVPSETAETHLTPHA